MISHPNQSVHAMISKNTRKILSLIFTGLSVSTTVYAQTYSGDKSEEVTAKKCKLARDIISGKAVHADGTPTDAYDIEVAKSDIKIFCKDGK